MLTCSARYAIVISRGYRLTPSGPSDYSVTSWTKKGSIIKVGAAENTKASEKLTVKTLLPGATVYGRDHPPQRRQEPSEPVVRGSEREGTPDKKGARTTVANRKAHNWAAAFGGGNQHCTFPAGIMCDVLQFWFTADLFNPRLKRGV